MREHVHFIGIGGTGLSAIARILLQKGYSVSGSDQVASIYFDEITKEGAKTYLGHSPENILGADLIIRSSAINDNNPEILAAKKSGIPVYKRSEYLPELLSGLDTIAIAGTHGKTTTTAMIITILKEMRLDPSFIIGANIKALNTNAETGQGSLFVIEADEYDHMFMGLNPLISVVTNIEHDHPDCYPTPESYQQAFVEFLRLLRLDGAGFVCIDDPGIQKMIADLMLDNKTIYTYGFSSAADFQATNIRIDSLGLPVFDLKNKLSKESTKFIGTCYLKIPGEHNILNALAALAVIDHLGLSIKKAIQTLSHFNGTERRFDVLGTEKGITIINDYAHHPTQIRLTLNATRERYPSSRIWTVWEPHTYSRTSTLEKEFIQSLDDSDKVIITKIYAAREADTGYRPTAIINALQSKAAVFIPEFDHVVEYLLTNLIAGDVVLVLSAGYAPEISQKTFEGLKLRNRLIN
ncbi:MAG: UDP-N-acetylmuramate--L-alanine ligase [Anaerolineaceae bacterium]|nr:UDP-N-acetylmuramate--L-alanine ligase [Anaerolineaceae bacterium]